MTQDDHRHHPEHMDSVFHGDSTNQSSEWQGKSNYKIEELGRIFGKVLDDELTQTVIDKFGSELGKIEDKIEKGGYKEAAVQLNAFWDSYLQAGVKAEIDDKGKNKQVNDRYGSRLEQAESYEVIGSNLREALENLNHERHKPGHKAWSDVDTSSADFQQSLDRVFQLSLDHLDHLIEHHQ